MPHLRKFNHPPRRDYHPLHDNAFHLQILARFLVLTHSLTSPSKDFRGGFTTELAGGVIDDAVSLMKGVHAQTALADNVKKVFDEARRNDKCRGMEARSVWRLFSEDGGRDVRVLGMGEQDGRPESKGIGG